MVTTKVADPPAGTVRELVEKATVAEAPTRGGGPRFGWLPFWDEAMVSIARRRPDVGHQRRTAPNVRAVWAGTFERRYDLAEDPSFLTVIV